MNLSSTPPKKWHVESQYLASLGITYLHEMIIGKGKNLYEALLAYTKEQTKTETDDE